MIQGFTRLNVADNSGAKVIGVIQVQGNSKGGDVQRFASIGDIVSASVKKAIPNSNVLQPQYGFFSR